MSEPNQVPPSSFLRLSMKGAKWPLLIFFKKHFTFENTVIQPVLINILQIVLNI